MSDEQVVLEEFKPEDNEFLVLEELFAKVSELEKEKAHLNELVVGLKRNSNKHNKIRKKIRELNNDLKDVFFLLVLMGIVAIIGWLL